jgi:hypothetical protein
MGDASGQRANWAVVLAVVMIGVSHGQRAPAVIDFLDDGPPIPESTRFRMPDYIESGVGLSFGVDRRLSYDSGNYSEAVERFQQSITGYRYKAEIWVFLARAHFYSKSPFRARETIERASATMPDLQQQFWDPLLNSMLQEVRRRANKAQTEVDFYSRAPGDFLALFRMYIFLGDYEAAAGVIHAASGKGMKLMAMATMASAEGEERYRAEVGKWLDLAKALREELGQEGELPPDLLRDAQAQAAALDAAWPVAIRVLQLKVDYYPVVADDFRQLFQLYMDVERPDRAADVLTPLGREIKRLQLLADVAPNRVQEKEMLAAKAELEELLKQLRLRLGETP